MSDSNRQAPVRGATYLYMAAAFVVVVFGMRAAAAIVNPLLLAIFLSVISAPAYFGLLRRGVANWLALSTVIGVLSIIMVTAVLVMMESIAGFTSRHEHYRDLLDERTAVIQKKIDDWIPDWARSKKTEEEQAEDDENIREGETLQEEQNPNGEKTPEQPVADAANENAAEVESAVNEEEEPDSTAVTDNAIAGGPGLSPAQPDLPAADSESSTVESEAVVADGNAAIADKGERGLLIEGAAESRDTTLATLFESDADDPGSLVPSPVHRTFTFDSREPEPPQTMEGWKDLILEQFNPGMLISFAVNIAGSIGQLLSRTFLILLTVVFILLEAGTFSKKMTEAFAHGDSATKGREIVKSIHDYIVIKTWVSLATGVFIAIWLKVVGVPYAGLWGLLAFMLNFIPNVGSIIAAVPAVLIAWLELTALPAVACAIGFLLVNGVIGNFVEPRMMGKGLGISPLVVFCSMVFWGWVLGPVGMLLSVPLTMTARIAFDGFDDTKWLATLMGNAD